MDFIKKTICIENARTRTQGLMPYFEFGKENVPHPDNILSCDTVENLNLIVASGDNGNWGQFVANPCFLSEASGKTYETMLHNYYALLNDVRSGTKLRIVNTKEGEIIYTEDVGAFYLSGSCFSGGSEPDYLYEYAAYDSSTFYSVETDSLREETKRVYRTTESISSADTFIVLIEDFDHFRKLATYLDGTAYQEEIDAKDFSGETITIPEEPVEEEDEYDHYKWAKYCQVVDACIGRLNIPASIYNNHIKTPKTLAYADIKSYLEWLNTNSVLSASCCDGKLWEDRGGQEMIDFLSGKEEEYETTLEKLNGLNYTIPYMEMPLLLIQNFTDVGVFTNVDGVDYERDLPEKSESSGKTRPHGIGAPSGFTTIDEIIMGEEGQRVHYPTTEEYNSLSGEALEEYIEVCGNTKPVEVESLLKTLRSKKKYLDDEDNVLPGLFKEFDSNKSGEMFVCIKMSDNAFYKLVMTCGTTTYWNAELERYETRISRYYLKYENDETIVEEDIYGLNNFKDTGVPAAPVSVLTRDQSQTSTWSVSTSGPQEEYEASRAEAYAKCSDALRYQQETYEDVEKEAEVNPIIYKISAYDPIWEIINDVSPISGQEPKEAINADGVESQYLIYPKDDDYRTAKDKQYRTITTCESGIRIAKTEEEETGVSAESMSHYFFKVKYDNSPETPMDYPYEVGNMANLYVVSGADGYDFERLRSIYPSISESDIGSVYRGDFIIDITEDEENGKVYFTYVIGGYLKVNPDTMEFIDYIGGGDVYYEGHTLDPQHVDYVALDGVGNVPVWSKYIDFEADAKEFYSTRYGLYRTGNTANIIETTPGEVWDKDYSYDAYLTKEDYLINFSNPPKVDVNVTIDRGGVSVFERHYKLAECNTMQDLEQHGNNEFFS